MLCANVVEDAHPNRQVRNHLSFGSFCQRYRMERVVKYITLVFAAAATLAVITTSSGQSYLYGAPPGGVGTYAPGPYGNTGDPRFRDNNNNWRDSSPDNWRDNNWREDRSGWRRNNWREDRTDDWRPYNLRGGQAKEAVTDKKKDNLEDNANDDDCGMVRNRPNNYSNAPCRR